MLTIATKNLFADKTRLAVSILGVALSVTLMMVLWSLYSGWNRQIVAYVSSVDADVWVMPQGVTDLTAATPGLPQALAPEVASLPGVQSVTPIFARRYMITIEKPGRPPQDATTLLVGYVPGTDVGPVKVIRGAGTPGPGQIIIDTGFAREYGINIGDTVLIGQSRFEVAGISEGGNIFAYQIAFLPMQEAQDATGASGLLSFLTVSLKPGASVSDTLHALNSIGGVTAVSQADFIHANRSFMDRGFLPLIAVLIAIGFSVGVAVIGLTIYTSIIDRAREYGVLKAIGASNAQLYVLAVEQAVMVSTLGYVVGLGLSYGARQLGAMVVTTFITAVSPVDYGWVFGAALAMSMIASYVPVRRLISIDPVEVFKQ